MTSDAASSSPGVDVFRFPPRWRNVLVPLAPPRATALGMTLYSASKPTSYAVQCLCWAAARAGRGALFAGDRETWSPPLADDVYEQLWADWRLMVGRAPDGVAVYERKQGSRSALTLLLCADERSVLVRVRRDASTLAQEQRISEAAAAAGIRTFGVPGVAGRGQVAGWHWVGYQAMSVRPHRPVYRLSRHAADDVTALVESVVPRPAGTPEHWTGAHRDLVPWNLRRGGGTTWLIDWEDAGWAPPNADTVYLRAVVAATRPGPVRALSLPAGHREAMDYWARIVVERDIVPAERRNRDRLLTALGHGGAVSG